MHPRILPIALPCVLGAALLACTAAPSEDVSAASASSNQMSGCPAGQGGVVLIGGAILEQYPSGAWFRPVAEWIVNHAGGPGHAVVAMVATPGRDIDASDSGLTTLFKAAGAEKAYDVNFSATGDEQANDKAFVEENVGRATVIVMRGGDQNRYLSRWTGTLFHERLKKIYTDGGVLAGSSAGEHVLSSIVLDAEKGGLGPDQALADPWNERMTFTEGFLDVLPANTLADSHFTTRGRLGRLVPALARFFTDPKRNDKTRSVLGIGVDEATALLVGKDGIAEVAGTGSVTFLQPTEASQAKTEPGQPPLFTHLQWDVLGDGYRFDLTKRKVVASPKREGKGRTPWRPANPVAATVPRSWLIEGNKKETETSPTLPEFPFPARYLDWPGGPSSQQARSFLKGSVKVVPALDDVAPSVPLADFVVATKTFKTGPVDGVTKMNPFVENRVGGLQWALAQGIDLGLILDLNSAVRITSERDVIPNKRTDEHAMLLLDARKVTKIDETPDPWKQQSVTLIGGTLHLLRSGYVWSPDGRVVATP